MSSGNLTGLAAIVGKKRAQEPEDAAAEAAPIMAEPDTTLDRSAARKPRRTAAPEPVAKGAKYTDPDRVQLKVYVRRNTKIDAVYKWEREGRGDASDLIEHLLSQYLGSK